MTTVYLSSSRKLTEESTSAIVQGLLPDYKVSYLGILENVDQDTLGKIPRGSSIVLDRPRPKDINRLEETVFGRFPDKKFIITREHVVDEPVRSGRFPNVTVCSYESIRDLLSD